MAANRESTQGFSSLELLIVVGIILVVATIAIPSLLKSRQLASENAAVASLRTPSNAEAGEGKRHALLVEEGSAGRAGARGGFPIHPRRLEPATEAKTPQ